MTTTRRGLARAALALTAAAALAVTLLSAGQPAGAGTTPTRASTRDGAWRLAAQAPSAPRGFRGVAPPGQHRGGSGGRSPGLAPPRHHGTLRITGALRDGGDRRGRPGLSWRPGAAAPRGTGCSASRSATTWQTPAPRRAQCDRGRGHHGHPVRRPALRRRARRHRPAPEDHRDRRRGGGDQSRRPSRSASSALR